VLEGTIVPVIRLVPLPSAAVLLLSAAVLALSAAVLALSAAVLVLSAAVLVLESRRKPSKNTQRWFSSSNRSFLIHE
jgi:ABC-type nickel/cobalt efflux system permease component RcnA